MKQKNNLYIALIVVILLLLGIGGYFALIERTKPSLPITGSPIAPYLTKDMVISLLQEKELLFFTGCALEGEPYNYQSCVIEIEVVQEESQWIATITYDGLFDDSVRATKIRAIIAYQNDEWIVGESSRTHKCWPNRGHQEFSTEFCL